MVDKTKFQVCTKFGIVDDLKKGVDKTKFKDKLDCPGGTSEKQTTAAKTYCPKGQLNSKCPFGVFKSTKKPTKFL